MRHRENAGILSNRRLQSDYFAVELEAPLIAAAVAPGQFVHVQFPDFEHRPLRRPFSVFDADADRGAISVIYKVVGEGTAHLSELRTGADVNLLGPLGVGFSEPEPGALPVIVAGGYGAAATFLLARRSPVPCTCLIGGRSAEDLLLVEELRALGCTVRVSTEDGSVGHRGMVTELFGSVLEDVGGTCPPAVSACGPNAMLEAVSRMLMARGMDAEVSLDHVMCCGVGACFACVVKLKADTPAGWEYVRTFTEGPVFKASRVFWDD